MTAARTRSWKAACGQRCPGIEARIGKALFERRFVLTLMAWQAASAHALPLAPVRQIDGVKLITRAGAERPVDAGALTSCG